MGTPNYPDDWATQWAAVRTGLRQAMTAARSRVVRVLTVGDPAAATSIRLDPDTQEIVFTSGSATGRLYVTPSGALRWDGPVSDTQIGPA